MLKFDFCTEEKTTKTGKHKKIAFTFERKSNNFFTYIIKLIKSFF